MASREEKEAVVAQAMGYKGAEALREEAADRLKEQMLAEVRRQQEALRNPLPPCPCDDDGDESAFSRLRRSKRFWYLVFGTLLFLYMAFLIRWVCNDLAK